MVFDPRVNFAYGTVSTVPSPADSGTSLTLTTGHGARFPDPGIIGYNCTVWAVNELAIPANAEIIRVTAKVGDVLTIEREQEGSTARVISAGDSVAATITKKTLDDIEAAVSGGVPVGGIIMWSGAIVDIPSPYVLCDGTQNAPGPDLRDKFVVGAKQDDAGVAKTNIEGTLKATGGATGHSHSAHANLTHAGMTIGDHTGLTHSLAIANHPDLTHAALTHPAQTITQPPGVVPTFTGSHAAADVSVPSLPVAAVTADRPSVAIASGVDISIASQAIASGVDISVPSLSFASHAAISVPGQTIASGADISIASQAIASGADISAPSLSFASHAAISIPSQAIASGVDISMPTINVPSNAAISVPAQTLSHTHATLAYSKGATASNVVGVTSGTIPYVSIANASGPSAIGAAATASRPSLAVAAITGSAPTGSVAAFTASRPSLAVAAVTGSRPSLAVASLANASAPTGSVAAHTASRPSLAVAAATGSRPSLAVPSGADVSVPSQAIASITNASAPTGSHTHASSTIAIADLSFPSLSHQAIGTHVGTDYGVHAITQPGDHGVAGTLAHSFAEPNDHTISAHDTVLSLPNYYALAYIQRVA